MIKKYVLGQPFETEAVTIPVESEQRMMDFGKTEIEDGFSFTYTMDDTDVIYGLGEANRGINKRGYTRIFS